jgi:peptidoglycan/xylan/chitin deacetylase (PgdA/CDA1 family)
MKIAVTVDTEKDIGFMDTYYGIDEGLPFVLDLFKEHDIRATFFVSGESASYLHGTKMLGRIVRGSHEIASHGYTHADYRAWEYARIREDVCRSKKVLEEYTGRAVLGYRVPQFLLDEKIVKAIRECGFVYDSSLPDVSGISAARTLRGVRTGRLLQDAIRNSGLTEFPIDSLPIVRIPHGLMWANLISVKFYKMLFACQKKDFMVFYLHTFDVIKNKRRLAMDIKRKIFYRKNENGVAEVLTRLIRFWISRGVTFTKLGDECL